MPKKIKTTRVDCDLEDRDGFWVEFRAKTKWKVMRRLIRVGALLDKGDLASLDAGLGDLEDVIRECIVAWHWLGDDDKPLPLPSEDVDALGELDDDDIFWLFNAIPTRGSGEDAEKNSG